MQEMGPQSSLDFMFDWEPFIDEDDYIVQTASTLHFPDGLQADSVQWNARAVVINGLHYTGTLDGLPREFVVYNRITTSNGLSERLELPIRILGLPDAMLDPEHPPEAVRANRWLDFSDPYLGLRDREVFADDYCPVAGESGVGFRYQSQADLENEGVQANVRITGNLGSLELPAKVDKNLVTFVTPGNAFPARGSYRVVLTLSFPGGGRRKIHRMIHVNG